MAKKFPKDNQAALIAFFGDPGTGAVAAQLVKVIPPFKFTYGKKPFPYFLVHSKCAASFERALIKIWDYYGHDQKLIDKLKISRTSGTYAPRKVRNSKTKWSNHAYGSAVDINAEDDPLGDTKFDQPLPVVAAFKSEGWSWGGDYKGRKDAMHYEAVDRGDPVKTFDQWLKHYGCPPMGTYPLNKVIAGQFEPAVTLASSVEEKEEVQPPHNEKSVEIEVVQRLLKELGYHDVGDVDGLWGGKTAGAIAAFKNDRHLSGPPVIDEEFTTNLEKAVDEKWKRPIAPERANATPEKLAKEVPEIVPAKQVENTSFYGGITAFFGMIVTAVVEFFGEAWEKIEPIRSALGSVPISVWLLLAVGICGFLYWRSRKTVNDIAASYKTGERT